MWVYPLPFGARLIVEVDTNDAIALIEMRSKSMRNIKPVLEYAAKILRESFGRQFAEGGRPAWTPLAPSTIAAKQGANLPPLSKKGNALRRLLQRGSSTSASILIATGALRDSYRQKGTRGHIERFTEDSVEVGSSLPHAGVHQRGGRGSYMIRAKFKKALAFGGKDGETILRKAVTHPPLPKRSVSIQPEDRREIRRALTLHLRGERLAAAA